MLKSSDMKRRKAKNLDGYLATLRAEAIKTQKKSAWTEYQRALQQLGMALELDAGLQALHGSIEDATNCADLRQALKAAQAEYAARGLRSPFAKKLIVVHEADSGHHSCPNNPESWTFQTFHSDAPTCRRCGACDCDKCEHDQHSWECVNCWRDIHDERCDNLREGDPCTHDFEPSDTECFGLRSGLVSEETEDVLCENCAVDEGIRIISCDC